MCFLSKGPTALTREPVPFHCNPKHGRLYDQCGSQETKPAPRHISTIFGTWVLQITLATVFSSGSRGARGAQQKLQTYKWKVKLSLRLIRHEDVWDNGDIAPHILKLDTRGRWAALSEKIKLPIRISENGCTSQSVWTFWRRYSLDFAGDRNVIPPSFSLVSIPTRL